ncbi:trypsin-like peptidase domain-containing protein [Chloroflexota bacterium]
MGNKLIAGILIFLLIVAGGFGYYSYTLGQQINSLSEQLTTFQEGQAAQISNLSDELTNLREETLPSINTLKGEIGSARVQIGNVEDKLDEELSETTALVDNLQGELGQSLSRIDTLEGNISGMSDLSRSILDASEVYQKVNMATVQISNGEGTVGSGFIFDSAAHVLTAYHVIENLTSIYVIFADGRISTATSIGSSEISDVAVLTLNDSPGIEPPPVADSSKLQIGEPVVAIGSPFGMNATLTAGIVSQTDRIVDIEGDTATRRVSNLLQFDAPVNFGNSGGPLINSSGEIIGLIVARIGPDEGDGVNYAVSANKFKRIADSIIKQGSFDYPWIGISATDLTPQMVLNNNLETANGVLVREVITGGPAQTAGVLVDDIILNIGGTIVRDMAHLTSYLGESTSLNDTITLTLLRDTTSLELSLIIGKRST